MYFKSVEDYLEAIYSLILNKGYARTKDIAAELNVTSPSVSGMLKKLDKEGFVYYEKYGGITLTPDGEEIAKSVKHRHETLTKLLKIIFVSDEIAEKDACKLEHDLSPESIMQLTNFVKFIESRPMHPEWLEYFKTFCKTGKYECKKLTT